MLLINRLIILKIFRKFIYIAQIAISSTVYVMIWSILVLLDKSGASNNQSQQLWSSSIKPSSTLFMWNQGRRNTYENQGRWTISFGEGVNPFRFSDFKSKNKSSQVVWRFWWNNVPDDESHENKNNEGFNISWAVYKQWAYRLRAAMSDSSKSRILIFMYRRY